MLCWLLLILLRAMIDAGRVVTDHTSRDTSKQIASAERRIVTVGDNMGVQGKKTLS